MQKPKRGFICNKYRELTLGRVRFHDGLFETTDLAVCRKIENATEYGLPGGIHPRETPDQVAEIEAIWANWTEEDERKVVPAGVLQDRPEENLAVLGLRSTIATKEGLEAPEEQELTPAFNPRAKLPGETNTNYKIRMRKLDRAEKEQEQHAS